MQLVLKEKFTWNYAVSFGFILLAVVFANGFKPGGGTPRAGTLPPPPQKRVVPRTAGNDGFVALPGRAGIALGP